ncbi:MAG: zinc-dependent peptidase [Chitinophagaceae bacterium]
MQSHHLHSILQKLLKNEIINDAAPEYGELVRTFSFYRDTISQFIYYYTQLPDAGKLRFLKRVHYFKRDKRFHYVGIEEQPEMPVLISAAAVQLTFGLRKYLLPFFKDFYITPDAYSSPEEKQLYLGHVAPDGIHLSWKHFLEGFRNDKDGVNVALHEMAHALQRQNFMEDYGIDKEFIADFSKYTQQTGPVFIQALLQRNSILRNYAFTNLQEFWAVSVEAFFEMPELVKQYMPQLYIALCDVLNQDPLTADKIISASSTETKEPA